MKKNEENKKSDFTVLGPAGPGDLTSGRTVAAAAALDMQSIIRKQALPPLEVQAVQINEQGDSSLMQKSV